MTDKAAATIHWTRISTGSASSRAPIQMARAMSEPTRHGAAETITTVPEHLGQGTEFAA